MNYSIPNFLNYVDNNWKLIQNNDNKLSNLKKINFFIGNEAADADSIISSFATAYLSYISYYSELTKNFTTESTEEEEIFLPILSIPQEDLELRREVLLIFNSINIMDLEFFPSIDGFSYHSGLDNKLTIHLLDHNSLSNNTKEKFQQYTVASIIDHHSDLLDHLDCNGANRLVYFNRDTGKATAGSTCSIVASKFSNLLFNFNNAFPNLTQSLSKILGILVSVILIDTNNLNEASGKVTELDIEISNKIKDALNLTQDSLTDRFNILNDCKTDINFWLNLSLKSALKLDYKLFSTPTTGLSVGFSSILMDLNTFYYKNNKNSNFLPIINNNYFINDNMKFFIIMSSYTNNLGNYTRELGIIYNLKDVELIQLIFNEIQEELELDELILTPPENLLELENLSDNQIVINNNNNKNLSILFFKQKNLKASRKQVAPLIIDALEKYSK